MISKYINFKNVYNILATKNIIKLLYLYQGTEMTWPINYWPSQIFFTNKSIVMHEAYF